MLVPFKEIQINYHVTICRAVSLHTQKAFHDQITWELRNGNGSLSYCQNTCVEIYAAISAGLFETCSCYSMFCHDVVYGREMFHG